MKPKKKIEIPETPEFQNLIDHLALFSETHNALDNLQAVLNDHVLGVLNDLRPKYTTLQERLIKTEAALELLALKNPDWFKAKKTIKTLFGSVSLRTSKKLAIENEDAVIARLEREAFKLFPGDNEDALVSRAAFIARYTRASVSLNKEALEAEDDTFLATLKITRVAEENFSAKPAALDMGQAFKESPEQEQEAA